MLQRHDTISALCLCYAYAELSIQNTVLSHIYCRVTCAVNTRAYCPVICWKRFGS